MSDTHIALLQKLRTIVGPLTVTSGIRCKDYNALCKGAPSSHHIPRDGVCTASDITFTLGAKSNSRMLYLYTMADQLHFKGLGLYRGRIHVDSRKGRRARWVDHLWSWKDS